MNNHNTLFAICDAVSRYVSKSSGVAWQPQSTLLILLMATLIVKNKKKQQNVKKKYRNFHPWLVPTFCTNKLNHFTVNASSFVTEKRVAPILFRCPSTQYKWNALKWPWIFNSRLIDIVSEIGLWIPYLSFCQGWMVFIRAVIIVRVRPGSRKRWYHDGSLTPGGPSDVIKWWLLVGLPLHTYLVIFLARCSTLDAELCVFSSLQGCVYVSCLVLVAMNS